VAERPTVASVAREVRQVRSELARIEIELAQQAEHFARRDVTDERLKAVATAADTRLAVLEARLDGVLRDLRKVEERDRARRNLVYGAIASGVVALITAAITAGVLG
jgi:hypothetical protein